MAYINGEHIAFSPQMTMVDGMSEADLKAYLNEQNYERRENMLTDLTSDEGADKYPSVLGVKMYVDEIITSEREYNKEALSGKESISNKTNDLIADGGSEEMYPSASAVREYVDKKIGEIGGGDSSDVDLSECANSLKGNVSGDTVRIDDVSPIEHTVKAKVRSKNLLNADGMVNASFVKNDDGSYTLTKVGDSTRASGWVNISIPADTIISLSATNIEGTADKFAFQFRHKDGSYPSVGPFSPTSLSYNYFKTDSEIEAVRLFLESSVADGSSLNISGLQIELGGATEYVPYVDVSTVSVIVSPDGTDTSATEYTPDADGVVEGIKSLYPSMVITTDAEGAIIELEYNKDINKGVSQTWRTIRDFTIENEEVIANDKSGITWVVDESGNITSFAFDTDENGKPLSANRLRYIIYPPLMTASTFGGKRGYLNVYCNECLGYLYNSTNTGVGWHIEADINANMLGNLVQSARLYSDANSYANTAGAINIFQRWSIPEKPPIKKLKIACGDGTWFAQGAKVLVQICEEV